MGVGKLGSKIVGTRTKKLELGFSLIVESLSLKKVVKQKAWLDLSLKVLSLRLFEGKFYACSITTPYAKWLC